MKVAEVMTRRVECIDPDVSLQDAAARMKEMNIGPLPVCENDRLVGIVTDRDITVRATAEGADPQGTRVREVMTPEVVYCFDDQDVSEVARLMEEKQIRRLLVLNRAKRLIGIVSLGDLAVETHDERLTGHTLEAVSAPNRPER